MRTLNLSLTDLHTRDEAADGTLEFEGCAVPYESPITYGGVEERFARSAFDPSDVVGRPILWGHDRSEQIGAITAARNTDEGLVISGAIEDTRRGADVQKLMRRDRLRGLSVGFTPTETDRTPQGLRYVRAALLELSVTPLPAYAEKSTVTAVREEEPTVADTPAPETREAPQVDLAPISERIDQLEARMMDRITPRPEAPALSPREVFTRMVMDYGTDPTKINQRADMVSSGNPGLTSTERTSREIIEYFDSERYFVSRVMAMPFPESGIVHTLPRKTQRSQVGQAAEKAAPPSRAITTDTVQFTGVWYKGYLDISYELIRTSSPGAVETAVTDMLQEAAVESELEFIAAVEAASTDLAPLDFTTYKAFVASVRAAVRAIRAAAGKGQPKFALTSDSWDELLQFVDTTDRRLLSTVGAQNADGSASLVAEELDLAGVRFFESPHSSIDVAFNDNALKRSELAPTQLSADNVALVGRDVAVLGNIMAIPRLPAGVIALQTGA